MATDKQISFIASLMDRKGMRIDRAEAKHYVRNCGIDLSAGEFGRTGSRSLSVPQASKVINRLLGKEESE